MIKTSVMLSAHAIHLLIRNTLIFFIVLLVALFAWIIIGISIDKVQVSGYVVEGLYIKLDKRLTLKANKVIIPKRKANPSFDRIDTTFESIKYLLTFFDHIELEKIHFKNNILGIYYHDTILQLSSKDYLVRGNIHREDNRLVGTIPVLHLKEHDIVIRGEFTYDLDKDILVTEGNFLFQETTGFFRATKRENKIDFSLSSGPFSDLKSFVALFDVPFSVKPWIVDNIKAKSYQVLSLSGEGSVVNKTFRLDIDSLMASVLFSDVSISFKKGVAPVLARNFILRYTNEKGLTFDLEHPTYLGKNLDGSTVSIVNLKEDNTTLKLNLQFDTRFDEEVQALLKAYDITVPVLQKNGKVIASLDADIGLKKPTSKFVADVKILKSDVEIKGIAFPIEEGNLHYEGYAITLSDIVLKHPLYEGVLNGNLDLNHDKATFVFDAKKILLKTKSETLVSLKNQKIPFTLEYHNDLFIDIPKYTLRFKNTKKETILRIKDLTKVKAYLSDAIPIEDGGSLTIKTKDFETFTFSGVLKRNACFIYTDAKRCETRVPIKGNVSKNDIDFYAFDEKLHYNKKKHRVTLKDINIDLEKLLAIEEKEKRKKKKVKKSKKKNMVILGTNSHLRYGAYSLITDSYDVEVNPNGDINAIGSSDGDIIKFTKVKDILTLKALRIKDKTLHPLINFRGLQKGRYSITKTGDPAKVMKAEIIVEGGLMSGFKAYNNTLAFVNTIPALVTLQDPGYSEEGFTIQSAVIEYRMINRKKIIFDSIYIKGDSSTIIGKGELDLEKKTINIELGIQVARTLSKVVGSIPIVGYILVGKEKSVTVGLTLTGDIDKPIVKVSTAKDILSYPLHLIKRTFETPKHLLAPEDNNLTK